MPLLFSYGSLKHEPVQIKTFGRTVASVPDRLRGYTQTLVPITDPRRAVVHGTTHYANIARTKDPDCEVGGVTLELNDEELVRADTYEAEDGYVRVLVRTASGREAWVYVCGS